MIAVDFSSVEAIEIVNGAGIFIETVNYVYLIMKDSGRLNSNFISTTDMHNDMNR